MKGVSLIFYSSECPDNRTGKSKLTYAIRDMDLYFWGNEEACIVGRASERCPNLQDETKRLKQIF